jgi:cathepsin B
MSSIDRITLVFILLCASDSYSYLHPLSDEFINLINSKQSLWTAGRNFHAETPLNYIKRLAGTIKNNSYQLPIKSYEFGVKHLPKQFDARRQWPKCPTITDIRDQGSCGSCWAVASAAAMTDRVCIHSNAKQHFYFSDDDLLSCCKNCGAGSGCDGGVLKEAWLYYNNTGVVSGGSYNSDQGCRPYEIPPCEHNVPGKRQKCGSYINTPKCNQSCNNKYKIKYKNDLHKGANVYGLRKKVSEIKKEIYVNGPVSTVFNVYEDFIHYKHGIYNHTEGKSIGYHSVKLIGWGQNNGVHYWIAANTWNTDWGQGGFFKIIRGCNHCEIEENVVAGKPPKFS